MQDTTLDALVRSFDAPLRGFVARRVSSPADVDDLLQQIYLRAAEQGDRLAEVEHISGWIFTLARNAVVDHHRARGVREGRSEEPSDDLESERGDTRGVDETRRALALCMAPFLEKLADPYREALVLTEMEGFTQADAAVRAGISLSGMKSRVQRGREQLKSLVLACCSVGLDRRRGIVDVACRTEGCACGNA